MPEAMPPAAPPPGSPEEAADVAVNEQQAQLEAIAATAPMPEEPFTVSKIQTVVKELNRFADKASGEQDVPAIEWETPEKKWNQPLPPAVFVPLVIVSQLPAQFGFEKHAFDPIGITTDAALTKTAGQVRKMTSDAKFIKALQAPPEAPTPEAPPPEVAASEDQELMGAL